VLSVAGNQAVPAQCVAVVVDESGRRFAAIIPTLALPKKAIVGSTLWASMLRRRLKQFLGQGGRAVPQLGNPEVGPRLGALVGLIDDLAAAIETVGGHMMAAMDFASGLILGQGRFRQRIVRPAHAAP